MIATLRQFYGVQPAPPGDLFQFYAWEIVSAQTLPARRDLAWHALRRVPALTPDAMFRAPAPELRAALALAGPRVDDRIDRLRGLAGEFRRHRDLLRDESLTAAGVLAARRALRKLQGVPPPVHGRALLYALGYPVLPLDDDVRRLVTRLLGPEGRRRSRAKPWIGGRIGAALEARREAITYLRHHAQQTCVRGTPHCTVCPLRGECRSVERGDAPA
jgi:endonuclease III